jgi:hypothetical protein
MSGFMIPKGLVLVLKWYFPDLTEATLFLLMSNEADSAKMCAYPSTGRAEGWAKGVQHFFRVENNYLSSRLTMNELSVKPTHPTKEQVRHYLENRQAENKMPPSLDEIRRQLGWHLCDVARDKAAVIG